ncbi:MAG: pyroglutamyl-peptidase I [Clostridia bacterium]|nr:pyroglutamyl-peptidase I [Clostridia bacterium]
MRKILLSAFEPFGGSDLNSSAMVLEKISLMDRDAVITKMTLPVLYEKAFYLLKDKIKQVNPDAVVCMGQAGGRNKVCVERIAVNINDSSAPDNGSTIKTDETIIQGKPAAYYTNLPYKKMVAATGDEAAVSYSAGTYICNDIFYRLMEYIETEDLHITGGFLHLPFTEHFGKMPYIDLEKQADIVWTMLQAMGE